MRCGSIDDMDRRPHGADVAEDVGDAEHEARLPGTKIRRQREAQRATAANVALSGGWGSPGTTKSSSVNGQSDPKTMWLMSLISSTDCIAGGAGFKAVS